jgi:hypothetical protein
MNWGEFVDVCPEIAEPARGRFEADELVLLGTLRADGSPRISPNEVDFAKDRLLLGMMWRSRKVADLRRDPRIVVHSLPSDRLNPGGDLKLYGRAVDESDPKVREAYRRAIRSRIDWAPEEPEYHLFSLDVESASSVVFGEDGRALMWNPERGLRQREVG